MYSCGPLHMDVQEWDDQHELTYSSYVRTRDVTLKTCRRRWMIGRNGERRSGISAQAARHDDDDDVLIKHLTQTFLYLDVSVAAHLSILFQSSVFRLNLILKPFWVSVYIYIYIYTHTYTLPVKSIWSPSKILFLILKVLFLMKQVKLHNVFIYYTKYKSSWVTLTLV